MEFGPDASLRTASSRGPTIFNWDALLAFPDAFVADVYNTTDSLEFRLDQYDILSHDGLLWLLSVVSSRGPERLTFVRLPEDEHKLRFLADLRFPRVLQRVGGLISNEAALYGLKRLSRPIDTQQHSPRSLRCIQMVANNTYSTVLQELYDYFERDVAELLGFSPSSGAILGRSQPFQQAIGEILINVALHAGQHDGVGFGYACYRPFPTGHKLIRFCCSDPGPGFRTTLARHSTLPCDTEESAVLHALLYRHFYPQDRVVGLYGALPFVRELAGAIRVRSGNISVDVNLADRRIQRIFDDGYASPTLEWVRRLSRIRPAPPVMGCHIALDLSVDIGGRHG